MRQLKGQWLEEYKCGCTYVAVVKKELLGYCVLHGEDTKHIYKLPEKTEVGHSHDPEVNK